jgi:histidinol-phosphate aminotransferase
VYNICSLWLINKQKNIRVQEFNKISECAMNKSRREFLQQSFGSAVFLTMGGTALVKELWEQQKLLPIKGAGVEEGIVQLIWNENPLGPSPRAMKAVAQGLYASNRYFGPELVEKSIAEYHNIDENFVTKGEGATELLYNVPMAFLSKNDNMIMADPTFSTAGIVAETIGAEVKRIPLTSNYEHNLDAFVSAINGKTKLILICNPNNPTGTITPAQKIKMFLDNIPEHIVVMIDEAYFHFAEHPEYESFIRYPLDGRNVVVVRTFSKIYGLAGLRIGYAIANEMITERIRALNLRGLTNLVAHYAVPAALQDSEFVEKTKKITNEGKNYFYKEFSALGYKVPKSEANHIFVDLGIQTDPIVDALSLKKIYIRAGSVWGKPTHIRISIGTMEENKALMKELKSLL